MTFKQILHHLNRRDTRFLPKNLTFTKAIVIFLVILTTIFSVKSILAQTANPTPTPDPAALQFGKTLKAAQDSIANPDPDLGSWNQNAMTDNAIILLGAFNGGGIRINEDGSLNTKAYIPGGVLGTATNLVASLYNQPVSGIEYIAQVKNNFLGKPAYAATGFDSLQPILPMWKVLRNIVYLLISIFFIIIGIMIMLRIKINPQTVVNVQNSIPGIITSLILVTFSYAIAGLLIDLSKLVYMVVLTLFFSAKGTSLDQDLFTFGLNNVAHSSGIPGVSHFLNLIKWAYTAIASNVFGVHTTNMGALSQMNFYDIYRLTMNAIPAGYAWTLGELVGQIFTGVLLGGALNGLLGGVGSDIGSTVGFAAGDVVGGILGWVLIPLIISILVTIWLMKLYFGMLKAYISVIFKIIIAPVQIGLGAFPGSKIKFSTWLIDILSELLVFPIVSIVLIFINYLTDLVSTKNMWLPSQVWIWTTSNINGGMSQVVSAGIGLAGLALLAKLPKLVPEAIFKLKPSPYGTAIGEAFNTQLTKMGGTYAKGGAMYGVGSGMEAIGRKLQTRGGRVANTTGTILNKTGGKIRETGSEAMSAENTAKHL